MPEADLSAPILLTGATGVLGLAVVERLRREGFSLRALVRDVGKAKGLLPAGIELVDGSLEDLAAVEQAVDGCRACVHMAGLVSFDDRDQDALLAVNYEGTRSIVNACLDAGVGHFVHLGSIGAIPLAAADVQTVPRPRQFSSYYGYTKRLSELEVYRASAEGLPMTILQPGVILGKHPEGRSSSSIFRIARWGNTAAPPGNLHWVAVADVAEAVAAALGRGPENQTWMLDAEPTTWKHLYELYRAQAGISGSLHTLKPWEVKALGFLSGTVGRVLKLPIPSRKQLLNLLRERTYPQAKASEALLGRPYMGLEEAVAELF